MPQLAFSPEAAEQYARLRNSRALEKRFKAVKRALGFLKANPRHPSLNTHEWKGEKCPHGDKIWEAYAQNRTPGAYRIFFCYPPDAPDTIWILAITPHP